MIRLLTSCFLCLAVVAAAAQARPLIASSEETAARLCHAFDDSPERLEALCAQALADGVATSAERISLLSVTPRLATCPSSDLRWRHVLAASCSPSSSRTFSTRLHLSRTT